MAGGSADGLLGADILLAFDIDLDLPARRITFYRARRECPEAAPPWNEPYVAVAGVSTRRDRLLVPFELDGVAGMAVLDTGAQFSSISQSMAERIGLAEERDGDGPHGDGAWCGARSGGRCTSTASASSASVPR